VAEPIKNIGKSPVGSGSKDIPVLERQVAPQVAGSLPGFEGAFSSAALTPTAMGVLSSNISMGAGIQLARNRGQLLGQQPEGNLLPPITDADKAFVESYNSQANATLSLRANALLNQGEEELNQSYKLTPQGISEFTQSSAKGLQAILQYAPDNLRPQLETKYASKLMDTSHSLNLQMTNQQKQEAKQQQMVYNESEVKDAFRLTYSGSASQGGADLKDFKKSLAQQRAAGIIDPKQEQALYDAAKLNYYSGLYSKGAAKALQDKTLPQYMRGMHERLPDNLSEIEKVQVMNNVMTHTSALTNAQAQDNQLIVSQLTRALSENTLTGSMLTEAQQQLPETQFNEFMTKFWNYKNKKQTEQNTVQELASNLTDSLIASQATPENLNKAFAALTQQGMIKHPGDDLIQVQSGIAKTAGTEIPAFSKEIDTLLTRGDPMQTYRAMRAYNDVHDFAPQNVSKVSKEARAIASIMDDLHQLSGMPVEDAWAQAREMVYPKNKEEAELREQQYKQYQKDNLATPDQVLNRAKSLLNTPYFTNVPDMPYVANRTMRVWKDWYMRTGDSKIADKLTTQSLKQSYGLTHINGSKQQVFMPVEKLAGITHPNSDSNKIIQKDIESNVSAQFTEGKEAYDKGTVNWYFEVKARQDNEGPVQVERIYRDSKVRDTYFLNVTASNNLQLTRGGEAPYAGYYDIGIVDRNGFPVPNSIVSSTQSETFAYRPNIKAIQNEYTKLHSDGLTAPELEVKRIEDFINKYGQPSFLDKARAKSAAADKALLSDIKGIK